MDVALCGAKFPCRSSINNNLKLLYSYIILFWPTNSTTARVQVNGVAFQFVRVPDAFVFMRNIATRAAPKKDSNRINNNCASLSSAQFIADLYVRRWLPAVKVFSSHPPFVFCMEMQRVLSVVCWSREGWERQRVIDTGPGSEASLGLHIIKYTRSGEREKNLWNQSAALWLRIAGCVIYSLYVYVWVGTFQISRFFLQTIYGSSFSGNGILCCGK